MAAVAAPSLLLSPLPSRTIPETRADCLPGGSNEARPCPHRRCRHHLASHSTSDRVHLELIRDNSGCSLDYADAGPQSLDEVGQLLGIVRQRVLQLEQRAIAKIVRIPRIKELLADE